MHPYIAEKLFGIEWLNLSWYGAWIGIGLLVMFWVLNFYGKKLSCEGKLLDFVFYDAVASIVLGFASANCFQNLYNYLEDPKNFQWESGITFLGGLLGGAACFLIVYFIFRKKLPQPLRKIMPVLPCCITVAHAFGRIGCFFAGCCYGKPTDSFLGVTFPGMSHPVHPTQLYESAALFLLFAACSFVALKKKSAQSMSVYLIGYGIARFLLEFLRDDDRGSFVKFLSPSQFWAFIMVIVGVVYCIFVWKKEKTQKENS